MMKGQWKRHLCWLHAVHVECQLQDGDCVLVYSSLSSNVVSADVYMYPMRLSCRCKMWTLLDDHRMIILDPSNIMLATCLQLQATTINMTLKRHNDSVSQYEEFFNVF